MNRREYQVLQNEIQKQLAEKELLDREERKRQSPYYLAERSPYFSQQQQRGIQLETRIINIERARDNVYLNVVLDHREPKYVNNVETPNIPATYLTSEDPENASYNVTKTESILDKCSDYYCSVIRFAIPLDEVPITICPIVPNQADPDLTPMILGIQYGAPGPATFFPKNVKYANQGFSSPPVQNLPTQVITPYYFMYSYQNLISMFNTALAVAYTNSGVAALLPGYLPPYFFLNPDTNLISLVVSKYFTASSPLAPLTFVPRIYMNTITTGFLDAFNTIFNGFNNPLGNDLYFNLSNPTVDKNYYPGGVNIPATTDPAATLPAVSYYYKFSQEYSVLEYWSSLRKIIISTNSIPINSEYVPGINNQGSIDLDQNGVTVSFPILADFVPEIGTSAGSSRSIAYYLPTAQYKLIDLISDNPLQTIDIKIFWQDRDGNLYPLLISILQQASMKIAFFRKTLYKDLGTVGNLAK